MRKRIYEILEYFKETGNYRSLKYVKPLSATKILYNSKEYLNLCSNSYLSLHVHPDVVNAARGALDKYGAGTCSSRSVSGSIDLCKMLENEIAEYKGYKQGLIFSNGYMANIGIVSTITEEGDIIFTDELNHSSLIDSTRLSRATKIIYRHGDSNDLEEKLRKNKNRGQRFILTESIFSMDGDLAPLDELYKLSEKYDAHIMLDDAHGTGIFGEKGTGVEELFGLSGKMDTHMATFGKALGSFGAFALADNIVIDFLINRARTFMYTTALPIPSLAASLAALNLIKNNPSFKDELWHNIGYMRKKLLQAGFDLKKSIGPIVPIVVGEDKKTLRMQDILLQKGLFLQAIRPPTVPEGASRLRLTIVRGLTMEEMDYAIETLIDVGKKMKLI